MHPCVCMKLYASLYDLKVNKNLKFKYFIAKKVLIFDQLDILQIWMVKEAMQSNRVFVPHPQKKKKKKKKTLPIGSY